MEKVLTVMAYVIAGMCAVMAAITWNQPGQTMVWTIALVGWLGAAGAIKDFKKE